MPSVLSLPAHLFLLRTELLTECGDRVGASNPRRISCLCPTLHANWGYRSPESYECWGSELRSLFLNSRHCCPLSNSASQTYFNLLAAKNTQSDCTDYARSVPLRQFSHLFLGRSSHTDHAEHCYCAGVTWSYHVEL